MHDRQKPYHPLYASIVMEPMRPQSMMPKVLKEKLYARSKRRCFSSRGKEKPRSSQASMCKSEGLKSEAEKMKTLSNEQMFSRFSIIDKVNLGEGRSS